MKIISPPLLVCNSIQRASAVLKWGSTQHPLTIPIVQIQGGERDIFQPIYSVHNFKKKMHVLDTSRDVGDCWSMGGNSQKGVESFSDTMKGSMIQMSRQKSIP